MVLVAPGDTRPVRVAPYTLGEWRTRVRMAFATHARRIMATPTFGIFDHIEDIPGTSTPQLLQDRLDLIKMADEAGFAGFHLAEHHGSDLCMAPNQEVFIAAASQITKNIRLGPMVKLLPLHHPVRIIEDMVRRRQPDQRASRLRRRPRRRTHRALLVRQQLARVDGALRRRPRHHLRCVRHGRDQQRELEVLRLPHDPDVDQAGPATRSRSGTPAARSRRAGTA